MAVDFYNYGKKANLKHLWLYNQADKHLIKEGHNYSPTQYSYIIIIYHNQPQCWNPPNANLINYEDRWQIKSKLMIIYVIYAYNKQILKLSNSVNQPQFKPQLSY